MTTHPGNQKEESKMQATEKETLEVTAADVLIGDIVVMDGEHEVLATSRGTQGQVYLSMKRTGWTGAHVDWFLPDESVTVLRDARLPIVIPAQKRADRFNGQKCRWCRNRTWNDDLICDRQECVELALTYDGLPNLIGTVAWHVLAEEDGDPENGPDLHVWAEPYLIVGYDRGRWQARAIVDLLFPEVIDIDDEQVDLNPREVRRYDEVPSDIRVQFAYPLRWATAKDRADYAKFCEEIGW